MQPDDFLEVDGIPVTSVARTLVDLAAVTVMPRIEEAMDDAFRRRLITPSELWEAIDRIAVPRRRGSRRIRRLATMRSERVSLDSQLELRFLRLVVRYGLPTPSAQLAVMDEGTCIARLDFAYESVQLAIEVDGFRFHSSRMALQRDAARQRLLTARGWRVMHITAQDMADFASVAAEIKRAIGSVSRRIA
jgi:hypothetical protein